jgi:membrane-associated protease RseP (regulator of RpoE activity)
MVGCINFTVWFPWVIAVKDSATGRNYQFPIVDPATNRQLYLPDLQRSLDNGLTYAFAVMLILTAHEAGHYLQARRYGVPGSLPMFIPMPFGPIGTMGAVILQEPGVANRKSLFDIAISGPLAGLLVALPLNWWGVLHSKIVEMKPDVGGFTNPRIVEWMIAWIHHPLKPGEDIALTPILHAGWVGIFITSLNLIPIGQLDGGHLLYCLIGRKAHRVAQALYFGAVAFVLFQVFRGNKEYYVWTLMLLLVGLMGPRHPPTADDNVPLGLPRIILGWLTLAFVLVGFVSMPMYTTPRPEQPAAAVQPSGAGQSPGTPQPENQPQGSDQKE